MKKNKRDFKGIWIPKEIWLSENLSMQEKIFLSEIDSLDNEDGCFASNGYFAEFFSLSKGRCSQIISKLEEKGYITAEYIRNNNKVQRRVLRILKGGIKYSKGGYLEYAKGNNTSNNNTTTNSVETPKAESDYPSSCEFLEEAKSIANHLLESIVEWDPDHKYSKNSPALKSWVVEIERAIRLDGRTKKQLDFVIDYVYNGNSSTAQFWSGNVQSGKKLRKHFDKIKNQIKQERGSSPKQEWNKSRANTLKEYN